MMPNRANHDYGHEPGGEPNMLPRGRRIEPDPLDFSEKKQGEVGLSKEAPLVVAVGALSPHLGLCWWLMLMSFLITYYYAKFTVNSSQLPDCSIFSYKIPKFIGKLTLKLVVLVGMLYWCFCITPFHVFAPTAMDVWTPYAVHDALRMTEVVYDPGHDASIDTSIFAIHGLGSRPDSAWTYNLNETKVRWLSELLPQTRGFRDARVVMINHQTRWDSNAASMDLNGHASELLEHIKSQHKMKPDRPIIFIAHSFGGLLLKKALLLAKSRSRDVAAMTKGIIFLGVPHRGTYASMIASCLSCMAFFRGSSSNLHEFMSVDGPAILDLESEFYDAYVIPDHPYKPQPYICDVLEMRPERMGKLVLGTIVRPKHGLLRHGRIVTLDTDHRGLNKFQSLEDPNFLTFLRILLQAKTYALQPDPFADITVPENNPLGHEQASETSPGNNGRGSGTRSLLDFVSYGMPWTTDNRLEALALGGLSELLASVIAKDRNRHSGYFTSRVFKTAFYECLLGVSIGQALGWLVFKIFQGSTGFEMRILQILVSNITVRSSPPMSIMLSLS
ncbi:nb-arc domain-containing protein [Fusarium heterosporum]|uniref:Nb-arc domain-containing protein n=1 Tax=Fusarium heterosporum TaxID=42747 RepID=A0A8H5TW63_FUSHE|nr:nb-arc domain-containing protein [Fusarium heterosporum]